MATQTKTQREQAGKKAAATRKRNAANRTAAATRRSASRTGTSARTTARSTARTTARATTRASRNAADDTRRQAQATVRLGAETVERELDYATTRLEAMAVGARRGLALQVGAALEARDAVVRTAEFAVRTASRRRTLKRLERRGERALGWTRRR